MYSKPALIHYPGGKFTVGQKVKFRFGTDIVDGVVEEDRGPLGVGGRRLYRIAFQLEYADPMAVELAEDEILTD
jgi:hypothetical protein